MTVTADPPEYVAGTEQYVPALVQADVDLVDQTVSIQIDGGDWHAAEWDAAASEPTLLPDGRAGHQRVCRTVEVIDFTGMAPGLKDLRVKLGDAAENPILKTQGIRVVA